MLVQIGVEDYFDCRAIRKVKVVKLPLIPGAPLHAIVHVELDNGEVEQSDPMEWREAIEVRDTFAREVNKCNAELMQAMLDLSGDDDDDAALRS